jgi:YrbI family 3-deoxy-D-manno-octulosonate 8-phosphate phosphatase
VTLADRCRGIELILSDVDGVLTDGGIVYDDAGHEIKRYHVRDGFGIRAWQRVGKQFGIVTGRTSALVERRCQELGIDLVRQGTDDKLPAARELAAACGLKMSQVCFIGDDLPDVPVIREAGLGIAVADAATDARSAARFVTETAGGRGAVREVIELILRHQGLWPQVLARYGG